MMLIFDSMGEISWRKKLPKIDGSYVPVLKSSKLQEKIHLQAVLQTKFLIFLKNNRVKQSPFY